MIIVAAHSCGMKFNPSHAINMSSELNVKQIEKFIITFVVVNISNIERNKALKTDFQCGAQGVSNRNQFFIIHTDFLRLDVN